MRREVRAGAQSVALQDRRDEARRRGLAVRSDDVYGGEALVGHVENGHQPAHSIEAEAHAEQVHRTQEALRLLPPRALCLARSPRQGVACPGLAGRGARGAAAATKEPASSRSARATARRAAPRVLQLVAVAGSAGSAGVRAGRACASPGRARTAPGRARRGRVAQQPAQLLASLGVSLVTTPLDSISRPAGASAPCPRAHPAAGDAIVPCSSSARGSVSSSSRAFEALLDAVTLARS